MIKRIALAAGIAIIATPAFAHHRPHHHHRHHAHHYVRTYHSLAHGLGAGLAHMLEGIGPRPHAWCGWYMRSLLGVRDAAYNLARNWAHFGTAALGPAPGVIVVFNHHVGIIRGRGSHGGWIVESGNDGHRVRTRERSLAGAIAFRHS